MSIPGERAAILIFNNPGLEEILFLFQIHSLRHPGKRILGFREYGFQSQLATAPIGNEMHVLLAESGAQAQKAIRHRIAP